MEMYTRTARMIGEDALDKIKNASVVVFGLGGVGGYCAEALVRAGVGKILLIDGDVFDASNLNRQLLATRDSIGRPKAEVALERARSINPDADISAMRLFYDEDSCCEIDLAGYQYAVDCIDSVKSKLLLAKKCLESGTKLISSMGTGNKLDPMGFEITDITKTSVCPLAKVMRRELKNMGIQHLTVLYSREKPRTAIEGSRTPGSVSFVPGAAGLALAGWVIRDITGIQPEY